MSLLAKLYLQFISDSIYNRVIKKGKQIKYLVCYLSKEKIVLVEKYYSGCYNTIIITFMEVVYMYSEENVMQQYGKFPWLVFKVAQTKYAVNSKMITGIIPLPKDITAIPASPYYIKGIIRARGEVITLVDLKNLFSIQELNNEEQMVVSLQDEDLHIGIVVDEVIGVEGINYLYKNNNIQNLCAGEYIMGVGNTEKCEDLILLLNDDKLTHMVRESGLEITEELV